MFRRESCGYTIVRRPPTLVESKVAAGCAPFLLERKYPLHWKQGLAGEAGERPKYADRSDDSFWDGGFSG